jgi:threo-3-hydroxy-L-aspartate ammonia-lyase
MLDFADVQAAAQRLRGVAHRTPVITSSTLDASLGCQVFLKAENLQRMGAFKFRGGFNAVNVLSDAQRARGVVAFSSGNHAQAVALAARLHGCRATIVMPNDAPALKLVEQTGAALIPPFDHLPVMAGQGTAALELIEDTGPLDALIVCVGGGGFLSGCAVAAKALAPAIEMFGAEPQRGDDVRQSLQQGRIVSLPSVPRTICDGQQTQAVGQQPFEVIKALVSEVLAVPDPVVVDAMRWSFERLKLVVEPSGACALAALLHHRERFRGRRVGITLSGGNIDLPRFMALMTGTERVD